MATTTNMTTLAQEHSRAACYYGDNPNWLIATSIHRDSSMLDRTNFESFKQALLALPAVKDWQGEWQPVTVERSSHWAVGWVDYLVIDPACVEAVQLADELRDRLEDYPVLDEMALGQAEHDDYTESWDNWGRSDYRAALKSRLYDGDNEESERLDLLKEALDDLTDEEIDKLRTEAAQSVNWEYQAEDSGVTINITGLADATDIERVIELCDGIIAENARQRDIKRLAYWLGASPAQAAEAVKLNIRLVSGLQALMQGMI